jgi:hypothetical protein
MPAKTAFFAEWHRFPPFFPTADSSLTLGMTRENSSVKERIGCVRINEVAAKRFLTIERNRPDLLVPRTRDQRRRLASVMVRRRTRAGGLSPLKRAINIAFKKSFLGSFCTCLC